MEERKRRNPLPDEGYSIAYALGEIKQVARGKIAHISCVCGMDWAWRLVCEAIEIEENGGMPVVNGSRNRTLGGIWFHLAKNGMTDDEHTAVYGRTYRPIVPPMLMPLWEERGSLILEATTQQVGSIPEVKINIIGQPGKIIEKPTFTMLLLVDRGPMPVLPKGMPVPSALPKTAYVVYVAAKQWEKVKEPIKNTDTLLFIDGVPCFDETYKTIAVFTTHITTMTKVKKAKAIA